MPPDAMTVRNSKFRSITGSKTGWPHFLHGSVANGAKSPDMNVLDLQRPHVTIFKGRPPPDVKPLLTVVKVTTPRKGDKWKPYVTEGALDIFLEAWLTMIR
jgi:hypothetical protein